MDYKKIIKSRSMRLKMLEFLSFIPDKPMLKIQYRLKTGNKLNLKNPKRFTEKLQWYKLYYKDPKMIQCVDKFDVREYVKAKGLEEILIPCYGVYDSGEDINWDKLPNQFVMKDTLGGGGNSVVIVTDKSKENIEKLKEKCREWTSINAHTKGGGREWPYYTGKPHRIIIDQYLECKDGDLPDYKFFCFWGRCFCFYVKVDYAKSHEDGKLAFFDTGLNNLNVSIDYCKSAGDEIDLPSNCGEMVRCAEALSADFPHARVDFYDVDGKIVFGEITFFNASGYMTFEPDAFDYKIGEAFTLPEMNLWGGNSITKY
jgi:hypothetical protein